MKNTINTTLTRQDAEAPIALELNHRAFSDVFGLGLILRSKGQRETQFATDANGLQHCKQQLEYVQNQCLWGLQGIGGLMVAANPSELCKDDLVSVGALIQNLAQLAEEAIGHMENVNSDLVDRANQIDDPKQAAYHADVHREAGEIRRTRSMSYADAVAMAAGRLSARLADAAATGEA
ncbi:hypothetical protein ACH5Y9_10705 [Methylomonas sp. BW4-1]|uniref:Uncharacterized protein n=1 Tax=Methylomonas defluvii TaxID=3045149 RepID=A0ABU4UE91_9GAMM|nr:hypothetical protein [Methylomonas sp. OY6]MDX8127746.1 hypothetical protein [Methylomonas sp. OY6]